jgi:hypothetical protein
MVTTDQGLAHCEIPVQIPPDEHRLHLVKHRQPPQEHTMNIRTTTAIAAATVISVGLAGSVEARRPSAGTAVISSTVTGTTSTWDGSVWVDGDVSGDLSIEVDEPKPIVGEDGRINMINLDLGTGFTITSVDQVTVVSNESTGRGCGFAGVEIYAEGQEDVIVKNFWCDDSDLDGTIEFTFNAIGIVGTTTVQESGDHDVESQYRTANDRRNKSYSWIAANETAISLSASE